MRTRIVIFFMCLFQITTAFGAIPSAANIKKTLLERYAVNYSDKKQLEKLKSDTLSHSGQAVEALIEVMKNGKYPDKNRWMATFLLGQIMGDKSAPFLVKFLQHPHWVMRMASVKTLQNLKQKQYVSEYIRLLHDDSLLVRSQALETISALEIKEAAPYVWAMLYDKRNYYVPTEKGKELKSKRTHIIKNVVKVVGDLKFQDAKGPLLKMVQKKKYDDIFPEMDIALAKITGKVSPKDDQSKKKIYWSKMALNTTTIK